MTTLPKRIVFASAALCIFILCAAYFLRRHRAEFKSASSIQTNSTQTVIQPYDQISLKGQTKEEATQAWWQRRERDKLADWKIPIRFYGRAVDERNRPVEGAKVEFEWTDLSRRGTSHSQTVSGAGGNFELTDVTGKNLGVRVEKEGFYSPRDDHGGGFEYGDPAEATYYEPSIDRRVIFHLRSKGKGEHLLEKRLKLLLSGMAAEAEVNLMTGEITSNGQLQVKSSKPWPAKPSSPPYDWHVHFFLLNGGFIETNEEFPFRAPESGYSQTYDINMPAAAGNGWRVSVDRQLYFYYGQPERYGRMTVKTDGSSRYVFIHYFLNESGSTDLESASKPQFED